MEFGTPLAESDCSGDRYPHSHRHPNGAEAQTESVVPIDVGKTDQSEDGVIVYEPDFFVPYRPTHAKDMLERVPGATGALSSPGGNLAGDTDRRSLRSQTTQILINGKRLTTKGNNIQDYFERIPASQVERIDVREIDADVGNRVINVVLSKSGHVGGTWSFGNVSFSDGQDTPTLDGSVSGESGNWSYTLSGVTQPRQFPRFEFEQFRNASDVPFLETNENRRVESRRYVGRGRVAYSLGDKHQAQVSGFVEDRPIGRWIETEFLSNIDPQGNRSDVGGNSFLLMG